MASALNAAGCFPATYNISWGYLRAPGSICRHYVGTFKHDLLYIEGAPSLLALLAISKPRTETEAMAYFRSLFGTQAPSRDFG